MRDLIGRTLGHYRIVEKIGEGGMGEVYRAHDERLDREVAIKVLPEDVAQSADRLARFEREAKSVAKLDHPNILAIHDFRTEDGVAYAVMELLEGEALRDLISKGGITTGKAVEYARAIADGLAVAHDKGIIHRDLKPENVFLTADGRIKILDFGLAKLLQPEVELTTETPTATLDTVPGGLLGTVAYMAPEQLQGKVADHRSDIFALGVVLYEMLAGRRPFAGGTTADVAACILERDPQPIPESVPPSLRTVVSKCLEKRPGDRFSSAHDLSLTLGTIDSTTITRRPREHSFYQNRWPYLAAFVIAAIVALVFLLPSGSLLERMAGQPTETALPRIVVLPFQNLGSPEDEFFADGITEELISRLAAVSGLQVISRTSAMYYKGKNLPLRQIAEELDVGYVLEGTVRWDRSEGGHGRVRITPQLVRVEQDSHLWAERYDRVLEDIFTVQTEIAEKVVAQLQVSLFEREKIALAERPTENLEAYEAYLRGTESYSLNEYERILMRVKMFERAVELDPGFARAWSRLSRANSVLYGGLESTPERRLLARTAAEKALALEPDMPEGHLALGVFFYKCGDYEAALRKCADALKIQPNLPDALAVQALIFRRQGKWEESTTLMERAFSFSPKDTQSSYSLANSYSQLRDFDKAEEYINQTIALAPDQPDGYLLKFEHFLRQGKNRDARAFLAQLPTVFPSLEISQVKLELADREFETALEMVRGIPERVFEQTYGSVRGAAERLLLECQCLYYLGDRQGVEDTCNRARIGSEETVRAYGEQSFDLSPLGIVNAYLGRRDDAIRVGKKAVDLSEGDALLHPLSLERLAYINTLVGERDAALDQIEYLLSIPSDLTVGYLRVHPFWDPLRDNPRFQALLEKHDTN